MTRLSLAVVVSLLLCNTAFACLSSGTSATIQAELDAGRDAVLCAGTTFQVNATIVFKVPNTKIYTDGLPTGSTRALLRVNSSAVQTAVRGHDVSGVELRNVRVDGSRPTYGYVRTASRALLEFGGNATGHVISFVEAWEPRGWSTIHVVEGGISWNGSSWTGGCTNATVVNNYFHHAGEIPGNNWADGISFACRSSLVADNTIMEATDGGIVVFGAPGSVIERNLVRNYERNALGGINMVDGIPFKRNVTINGVSTPINDYTGTIVRDNTIDAGYYFGTGVAAIRVALGMGPRVWFCTVPPTHATLAMGGTVTNNLVTGNSAGYWFAADGVHDWTFTGNNVTGWGAILGSGGCDGSNAMPYAFLKHGTHVSGNSTFQTDTHDGKVHNIINQ